MAFFSRSDTGDNQLTVDRQYKDEEESDVEFCAKAMLNNKTITMWDLSNNFPIAKLHIIEV